MVGRKMISSVCRLTRHSTDSTFQLTTRRFFSSPTAAKFHHELTLYQYAICPYCNIAKALLNYTNMSFDVKEVNPLTKKELGTLPIKDYRKVPILLVKTESDTQQINGSESIVDHVLSVSEIDSSSHGSQKWTAFARDDLAPLLYPNLCNSLASSYKAFGYVHSADSPFSLMERYSIQFIGSFAMYMAATKIKKKRNITDERVALFDALDNFNDALKGEFLDSSAAKPHLGDLTIYGVLRGLKGLPIMHTIHESYPTIASWYQRMESLVEVQQVSVD